MVGRIYPVVALQLRRSLAGVSRRFTMEAQALRRLQSTVVTRSSQSGGSVTTTTIYRGGEQSITNAGLATGTIIRGGEQRVSSGGSAVRHHH
ncbi:hypothetical protein ACLB1M_01445 [Escherichia coli]